MILMKATITVLYEADPKNYVTNDPKGITLPDITAKKMAEIDMKCDPEEILQFGGVSVVIEEAK